MPKLLWLLHRQNESPSCCQLPANFCHPTLRPPASGSPYWSSFPPWLISFQGVAYACDSSSCVDQSARVPWSLDCLQDLRWWLHLPRLPQGVSLRQVSPDLDFWSDTLAVGWGPHLGRHTASGLWSAEELPFSISAKELLAVRRGLLHFQSSPAGKTIAVFCDSSTAVAYLRKEDPPLVGVARHPSGSAVYSRTSQRPGGHSVSPSPAASYRVVPQHGRVSIFASSVAGSDRLVCHLRESPMFDLFLSLPGPSSGGPGRVSPVLGRSSGLRLSSMVHHSSHSCETPGVSGDGAHPSGSVLAQAALVSGPPPAVAGTSSGSSGAARPPAPATILTSLPGSPQASSSCLATLRRFTRAAGFSSSVAAQASLACRSSSRKAYQLKWSVYRSWCQSHGHSISRPSLSKVADFLCWLQSSRSLSVFSIKGYCSMLSAVFRFHLLSLSSHPVIRDLLRSFCLVSVERQLRPPVWDLSEVLRFLNSSTFEPLSRAPLRALTQKVLFLLALATAKRVGELQVLSSMVTFDGGDACLSYVPQFVAKSESLTRSIPCSFLVRSLSDFAAGLDHDLLLCPVRALRVYRDRTRPLAPVRHRLFGSPRRLSCALSKNAVSFFLRDVIIVACASRSGLGSVRAHDIREVSTSVTFLLNWSVSAVLESATWGSSSVFASFIFATFNTNTMAFALWVRLWLRVRGSCSPHLFLTCSGGGGGPTLPLSPLPHGSFTCFSGWMRSLPFQ